ncbi:cache domain-containing sensor histidine kinase [Novibacillus thermophilus]|nr:sensor histidine kinase [Novibacillus thermophilus]
MVVVLLIVGVLTYHQVSMLLKSNAEEQMQQTAIEANGRFESLYEQINMVTKQVATDEGVQRVLLRELRGERVAFGERQSLMKSVNTLQATADGIYSLELYTRDGRRLLPLDDGRLADRIGRQWVKQAERAKGGLVWVGEDPEDDAYFLALRRVSLIDRPFVGGGYLLIRISQNYFQLHNGHPSHAEEGYTILVDQYAHPIVSNFDGDFRQFLQSEEATVTIDERDYMKVRQSSDVTGWTLVILTPVSQLTQGISVIRTGIVGAGIVGFVIFSACSFFLSTMITQPIVRLTETMRRASEGKWKTNPVSASTSEINELNHTYNQLVKETNHLIQMVYEKELTRSRTELKALEAQIHPHFLFNTLDALYWSLEEKNEEELAERVLAMSELFRYTISRNPKGEWVTIKEEMAHIDRYLQLMKMRFGERLKWHLSLPAEWERVRIPKLLIQPLVENAIVHGTGNKAGDSFVTVTVDKVQDEERLVVNVTDDGPGIDRKTMNWIYQSMEEGVASPFKGNGIAIANVHKRLRLYYSPSESDGLVIQSEVGKGTSVSFEIPIHGGEKDELTEHSGRG